MESQGIIGNNNNNNGSNNDNNNNNNNSNSNSYMCAYMHLCAKAYAYAHTSIQMSKINLSDEITVFYKKNRKTHKICLSSIKHDRTLF